MTTAVLVDRFRNHVTHFSEELKIRSKIKDDVVVGGRVIEVASLGPIHFGESYYKLVLMDPIGTVNVLISDCLWGNVKDWIFTQENPYVLVKGIVNVVSRKLHDKMESQYTIIGYEILPMPE